MRKASISPLVERTRERLLQAFASKRFSHHDPLPTHRQWAKELGVSHFTISRAMDLLKKAGIVESAEGSYTYLRKLPTSDTMAAPAQPSSGIKPCRRLGLLYVDLPQRLSSYSQHLTMAVQRTAMSAGYEVVLEEMRSADLVQGKMPGVIQRRSVDALLLDGVVRDHHIRFLEDHPLPYFVMGNCPLGSDVPQVRIDAAGLTREITRELLKAGRDPVWLDVDLSRTHYYHTGLEMFRGYSEAIRLYGGGRSSLHLCPFNANQVASAAAQLAQAGLKNAAIILTDWSSALLPAALALKSGEANELLIVPWPQSDLIQNLGAANIVHWSQTIEPEEIAQQAVSNLIAALERKIEQVQSLSLHGTCRLRFENGKPKMELSRTWRATETFAVERPGPGPGWRHLENPSDAPLNRISQSAVAPSSRADAVAGVSNSEQ